LVAIEKRMTELANKDEPVLRRVLPRDEAVAHFKSMGEHYKAESLAAFRQIKKSACTAKARLKTCAVARMCPVPASSSISN
jgi:threonyl-tRNA synthetase